MVITSYGSLLRIPWLTETRWRLAVLDEAQAIKNPNAKQTRSVKKLKADSRFALTGTPVENRLGRSVVDLRLHQSRTAGIGKGVHQVHQAPRRTDSQSLWTAAGTGAPVYSAAAEDRQDR